MDGDMPCISVFLLNRRRRTGESCYRRVSMIHAAVAESAGVTLGDLDSLLTGRVYASIADKLGIG